MHELRRARRRLSTFVMAVVAVLSTSAQAASTPPDDPLQSAGCRSALESLRTQERAAMAAAEEAPTASAPAVAPALAAARQATMDSCLRQRADARSKPARPRAAAPVNAAAMAERGVVAPLAVPSIAVTPMARRSVPSASPLGPAPRASPLPLAVTSCDPGGCWANDGSRLSRAGPALAGPRGLCTLQGTLLRCP